MNAEDSRYTKRRSISKGILRFFLEINTMREFHVHNRYHLGDSIFMVHYLRKVCSVHDDIRFICHMKQQYFEDIKIHIGQHQDRIVLETMKTAPLTSIGGWSGCLIDERRVGLKEGKAWKLNEVYLELYESMSEQIGIENPFKDKCCTVMDHEGVLEPVSKDFDCDILIGNCPAFSGQFKYKPARFVEKIKEFQDKSDYKITTVHNLGLSDVPCTLDSNLNLLQIGNIAMRAKYIIAIASAPIIYCFNAWNIDTVKKWVVLSNRSTYTYNDRIVRKKMIQGVTLDVLES